MLLALDVVADEVVVLLLLRTNLLLLLLLLSLLLPLPVIVLLGSKVCGVGIRTDRGEVPSSDPGVGRFRL